MSRALRERGILLFIGALAVAAAALVVLTIQLEARPAPFDIPWWGLALLFACADACMVHFHFRRDAHSFTLSEMPLALGLVFAGPGAVVLGRLLGGLAIALARRQPPVKLAFNVALFAIEAAGASLAFYAITEADAPFDLRFAASALAAMVAATVIGAVLVFTVISLSEARVVLARLPRMVGLGAGVTLANGSLALPVAAIAWHSPSLALLLVIPAVVLVLGYRAYLAARQRHASLQFLYDVSRELEAAPDLGAATLALVSKARELFRAESAEIILFPSETNPARRTKCGPGESSEVLAPVPSDPEASDLLALIQEEARIHAPAVTRYLGARKPSQKTLLAPVRGEDGFSAALVIGSRLGGADSYDRADTELLATLAHHVGSSLERIHLSEKLEHQAFHDALTGLPNWAHFRARLERTLETEGGAVVLVLDVDDFKTVNDSLGHAAGDMLLVEVASRLRRRFPLHPPARLGGDEFAFALRIDEGLGAAAVAEAIAEELREPISLEAKNVHVSTSIGIAYGQGGATADELMRNADLALYNAKAEAKGSARFFEPSLHAVAMRRLQVKADLQRSLDRGDFELHYQPIVELPSGRPAAVEALVRWRHPHRGLLLPGEFLDVAEETGLDGRLGDWILDRAIADLAFLRRQTGMQLSMNVNISVGQLMQAPVGKIEAAVRRHGVPAEAITVELTEGTFLGDEATVNELAELRRLGVRVAIDDFGTGYSSLSYLARLPITSVKIAKPFIDDILHDDREVSLADTIIRIGETLGIDTVAEGIESPLQVDYLCARGCPFGQGFLFAQPLARDAAASALEHLQRRAESPAPALAKVLPIRH